MRAILNRASNLKALADTGDRIHGWSAQSATGAVVNINLANVRLPDAPVIDVPSEAL